MPKTPKPTDPVDFNPYTTEEEAESAEAPVLEDAEPTAPTELPRNPDGTFAKREEPPQLSPSLRREAKQVLGWSDDDLAAMTPVEVRRELSFAKAAARWERVGRTEEGRGAQAAPPSEPQAWSPLSADATDYETLVQALNGLAERVQTIEQAAQHIQKLAQHIQVQEQREQLALADEFDAFFAEHPETYGTGAWDEIDRDGPDFGFREAMVKAALKANRGRTKGIRDVLVRLHAERTGRQAVPPRRPTPLVPDAAEDEMDRQYASGAGVLGRPSQRSSAAPARGYEAALQETDAIFNRATARENRRGGALGGTLDGLPE